MSIKVLAEGPTKITKATIEAAWRRRSPETRIVVRDTEARGLALTVNRTSMTWTYAYRPRGLDPHTGRRFPSCTVTLGSPASLAPDEARTAANRVKGQTAAGDDPAAAKRAAAEKLRLQRAATLGRLLELYSAVLPTRGKLRGSGVASARHVREEVTRTRDAIEDMSAEGLPAAMLTPAHVRTMLDATATYAATARARFGSLSRFCDWLVERGDVQTNPCALIGRARRPKAPPSRGHFLSVAEVARLWRAADDLPHSSWRGFVKFLLAIPARRGEIAALDWRDLDMASALWKQRGQNTKNRQTHQFHLHPLALDVLRDIGGVEPPRAGTVFPAPEAGGPLTTFSSVKSALDAASGVTGWTWHDLRRSYATALGEAGHAESVIDATLNHSASASRAGVLGTYQRATRAPEQRAALDAWGSMLAAELAPQGNPVGGNVISMTRRQHTG